MGGFDLLMTAVALVLVVEGILPFLSPTLLRRYLAQVQAMDDRSLRLGGLAAMLSGVGLLYLFGP